MSAATYETLLTEIHGRVALIRFNRPQALNALNRQVGLDLDAALTTFEADKGIGAIVLTLRHRKDVKRQNVLHQMWRDPAKAMELKDVKPGQGL